MRNLQIFEKLEIKKGVLKSGYKIGEKYAKIRKIGDKEGGAKIGEKFAQKNSNMEIKKGC